MRAPMIRSNAATADFWVAPPLLSRSLYDIATEMSTLSLISINLFIKTNSLLHSLLFSTDNRHNKTF